MHLAAHNLTISRDQSILPKAAWDAPKENQRMSTCELTNLFRAQLWSKSAGISFSAFVKNQHQTQTQSINWSMDIYNDWPETQLTSEILEVVRE